jgi:hypothetical protein
MAQLLVAATRYTRETIRVVFGRRALVILGVRLRSRWRDSPQAEREVTALYRLGRFTATDGIFVIYADRKMSAS